MKYHKGFTNSQSLAFTIIFQRPGVTKTKILKTLRFDFNFAHVWSFETIKIERKKPKVLNAISQ